MPHDICPTCGTQSAEGEQPIPTCMPTTAMLRPSGLTSAPSHLIHEDAGVTLFEEPHFTFRFADDWIIPRFHLEGVGAGRRVTVFRIDPTTDERMEQLALATVGEGWWVELPQPIIVRAGEVFVAVPESDPAIRE